MNCPFCTILETGERVITKNDLVCAFPTNIPITPGHTLVAPVRHVALIEDLTKEEHEALFVLATRIKEALKKSFGAQGFNIAWNENKVAGQSVPHFHLHIVPRREGDTGILEYEPRKFLYRPGERETSPEEELKAVAHSIRDAL